MFLRDGSEPEVEFFLLLVLDIDYSNSSAGGLGKREDVREGVKVRQKQDHELPFEPSLCFKKGLA